MTDSELLTRYVRAGDQAAFAALVRRHAGLVLATARRVAPADADDVAQATFLVLSRRSATLVHRRDLAGWLYETARLCADNARRVRTRRERTLRAARDAAVAAHRAVPPAAADELAPLLDAALARLPGTLRDVVLLRHLESLGVAETAERLGVTATTVTKRTERGLARLRDFFAARGHATVGVAGVSALLASQAIGTDAAAATITATSPGPAAQLIAAGVGTTRAVPLVAGTIGLIAAAAVTAAITLRPASPFVRAATAPTTTPVGASVDAPIDGLSVDAARATAEAVFAALRDADAARLAPLLARDEPERALVAELYVKRHRFGDYADYPERLAGSFDWVVHGPADRGTSAVFDARPPTLADLKHLQLMMQPWHGRWGVREVTFDVATATLDGVGVPPRAQPPATLPADAGFAPGGYARALAAYDAWQTATDHPPLETATADDGPVLAAAMDRSAAALDRLVALLAPTDLAVGDERAAALRAATSEAARLIRDRGAAAFLASAEAYGNAPERAEARACVARLHDVGQVLVTRAAYEAELDRTTPRPPAVAGPIELFVAWDGSTFALPGPLVVPPWLRALPTYGQWQRAGGVTTMVTKDDAGHEYEVAASGFAKRPDGTDAERIALIRQYRPDGTLAAVTRFDADGHLAGWDHVDATGERYTLRVRVPRPEARGVFAETEVTFFEANGDARVWQVNERRAAWRERETDPVGDGSQVVRHVPNDALPAGRRVEERE